MSIFDEEYLPKVIAQYPNLKDGWSINMLGNKIDLFDTLYHDKSPIETFEEHVNDGMFQECALEQTLETFKCKCEAPSGCIFVRLEKEGEDPVLVTLKIEED